MFSAKVCPWGNTGSDQTKLVIVFEILELEGQMAHKASYKYKWGNKENWHLWEKEESLLDIEGEAEI